MGLEFSPSNRNCIAPANQALFWPIRTAPFGPIKLPGLGVLIDMRMDRDFCPYKPVPSGSESALYFSIQLFGLSWNTEDVSPEQSRSAQHKADWHGAEQTIKAAELCHREGPGCGATSQPCCFRSCAVSQLSRFTLNIVFFFTDSN